MLASYAAPAIRPFATGSQLNFNCAPIRYPNLFSEDGEHVAHRVTQSVETCGYWQVWIEFLPSRVADLNGSYRAIVRVALRAAAPEVPPSTAVAATGRVRHFPPFVQSAAKDRVEPNLRYVAVRQPKDRIA